MLIQGICATSLGYFGQNHEIHWQRIFKFAFVGATGAILNLAIIFCFNKLHPHLVHYISTYSDRVRHIMEFLSQHKGNF
jgi:putative flippase GtrA